MRKTMKSPGEKIVKDITRATRKHYSSEEKIRIVLDGLRGEDCIAGLCRREGISQSLSCLVVANQIASGFLITPFCVAISTPIVTCLIHVPVNYQLVDLDRGMDRSHFQLIWYR